MQMYAHDKRHMYGGNAEMKSSSWLQGKESFPFL